MMDRLTKTINGQGRLIKWTFPDKLKAINDAIDRLATLEDKIERGEMVEVEGSNPYWYCSNCREEVDAHNVTFAELHDLCGHPAIWIEPVGSKRKEAT